MSSDEERLVDELSSKIARRLKGHMIGLVAGTEDQGSQLPWVMPLRRMSQGELEAGFEAVVGQARRLGEWAAECGVEVGWTTRMVGTTRQRIPSRVTIPSLDAAARAAGPHGQTTWTSELVCIRGREQTLEALFPALPARGRAEVLTKTRKATDEEFEVTCHAGVWFSTHDVTGMAPRSVPVPGASGKWIENQGNASLVCTLSGRGDLGLVREPRSFEFRFLDPDAVARMASDGRSEYGMHVEGRPTWLAYSPREVWVVENLSTFHDFPAVAGGICVYGAGKACSSLLGEVPWVRNAERVLYWGDIDAAGLEILNAYRASGLLCESVLMDMGAYEAWERYGTNQATGPEPLSKHQRLNLTHLTDSECRLYELLCSKDCRGYRRIEQEKIPFSFALEAANRTNSAHPRNR